MLCRILCNLPWQAWLEHEGITGLLELFIQLGPERKAAEMRFCGSISRPSCCRPQLSLLLNWLLWCFLVRQYSKWVLPKLCIFWSKSLLFTSVFWPSLMHMKPLSAAVCKHLHLTDWIPAMAAVTAFSGKSCNSPNSQKHDRYAHAQIFFRITVLHTPAEVLSFMFSAHLFSIGKTQNGKTSLCFRTALPVIVHDI